MKSLVMTRLIILFILVGSSCNTRKLMVVDLSKMRKYSVTEKHVSINLLKSYIARSKCGSKNGTYVANVYLCQTVPTNDTLLVISICGQPLEFIPDKDKSELDLIIDSSLIVKDHPQQVFANIDSTILRRDYMYLVADIIKLEY